MKIRSCRLRFPYDHAVILSVCMGVVFGFGGIAVGQPSNLTVDIVAQTLSASADQVPIQKVLFELSRKGQIGVFLDKTLKSKRVTANFSDLGFEEGIKKLVSPYSSAVVFGKRTAADGKEQLYVTEVKVFDSSNKNAAFEPIGATRSPSEMAGQPMTKQTSVTVASAPPQIQNPAEAAAMRKRVSASILRTRMAQKNAAIRMQQQKMRHEEMQTLRRIEQLKEQLPLVSESERMKMQAQLAMLQTDLRTARQRNQSKLRTLLRENNQLKHQQLQYGAALYNEKSSASQNQ